MKVTRIAIVVSHPIQHFCPQYSSWSRLDCLEVKVFFASRNGLDAYVDKGFGRSVKWDGLVMDFPHEFLPGAMGNEVDSQIDSPELPDFLSNYDPDIVLGYGYVQPLQRRAAAWAKINKKKMWMISDSELRSPRSVVTSLLKKFLLPRILSSVDTFLTVGDANEAYWREYGVSDFRLVRASFPIDVDSLDQAIEGRLQHRGHIRAKHKIPADHLIVLMVGKLVSRKRQRDLVQASNRLQNERIKFTVVLAGTGEDEDNIRALVRHEGTGGVVFAGFIPPQELVHYYMAADVYAHCSEFEAHSLAISEAIYAGLPVVVSDRCGSYGPSDDVRAGLNGFVYSCGDVGGLCKRLVQLGESTELRRLMGAESRKIGLANQELAHGKAVLQAIRGL